MEPRSDEAMLRRLAASSGDSDSDGKQVPPGGARSDALNAIEKTKASLAAADERIARSQRALADSEIALSGFRADAARLFSSRADLRAHVTMLVRRLRAEGLAPEQALIEVKNAVRDAGSQTLGVEELRIAMADVVRWAIDAYYA